MSWVNIDTVLFNSCAKHALKQFYNKYHALISWDIDLAKYYMCIVISTTKITTGTY